MSTRWNTKNHFQVRQCARTLVEGFGAQASRQAEILAEDFERRGNMEGASLWRLVESTCHQLLDGQDQDSAQGCEAPGASEQGDARKRTQNQ